MTNQGHGEYMDKDRNFADERNHTLVEIREELRRGALRMDKIEHSVKENTDITRDMYVAWQTTKAGLRFLGVLGKCVAWVAPFGALFAAFWAALHGKQ